MKDVALPSSATSATSASGAAARLAALTALLVFLTFDLVVFGAYTRLSDSGLGCPDWPGCYGQASPIGASAEIQAAQAALPGGPVTWSKAWIEMVHRYLATSVGALILVLTVLSWRWRHHAPRSPWWPTGTLAWVIVQGLFGRYTVTLRLYPAIVTLHLLGGLLLLGLLAAQKAPQPQETLPPPLRRLAGASLAVLLVQVVLGGWVSANYAVLACTGFPLCNGQWWPEMDLAGGFTLQRGLGLAADGSALPFEALVGIQIAHRAFAAVAFAVAAALAWRLLRCGLPGPRRSGRLLLALLAAQFLSGLSNVVLGWPLPAALAHSAGAAALVLVLVSLLQGRKAGPDPAPGRAVTAAA
jgi:cytochrome c oxidase assembly protein subunit 15